MRPSVSIDRDQQAAFDATLIWSEAPPRSGFCCDSDLTIASTSHHGAYGLMRISERLIGGAEPEHGDLMGRQSRIQIARHAARDARKQTIISKAPAKKSAHAHDSRINRTPLPGK